MYSVQLDAAYFPAQTDGMLLETTVGGVLRQRAVWTPDLLAVAEADGGKDIPVRLSRQLTYAQLLTQAEQLARALLSRFSPGERVAIWAPNSIDWVVFQFAAALAGLTLVTINPSFQARELRYVLVQSGAVALFVVSEYRGNPISRIAAEVVATLVQIRELVDLENRAALFRGENTAARLPEVGVHDPALMIYTSGTTGAPKGVVLSHSGVTNNSRFVFSRLDPPAGRPAVTAVPLFHMGGCVAVLGCLQQGSGLILLRMFDPAAVLALIESERAALVMGVPTMLFALLEQQELAARDVASVKRVLCGGSMIAPELVRRVQATFGCGVQIIYGQTECSGVLTQTHVGDGIEETCETVGQALPMMDVSIRHPATKAVLALHEVGEICARGYGVMLEYNDNEAATNAAIDADGWLHTGDLGAMDARGYVRITGRVKEMIIRGGENIYPAEIENVLLEHPDVAEVAVVGIPDDRWGEIVACFIKTAAGAELNPAALVEHCRARISPQKTPAKWIAVASWPLTGSGKIQKFTLRDNFVKGEFD